MDQNTQPTNTNQDVDALLNDILSGSSGPTLSPVPAANPFAATVPSAPASSFSSEAVSAPVNDLGMNPSLGGPLSAPAAMDATPFVDPVVPVAVAPGLAAVQSAPTFTPPTAPMNSSTTAPTPQMVGGHQVAMADASRSKTPLIAGGLVVAVILAGVGAGVVLSGQDQDVRNQAYVAPQQVAQQQDLAQELPVETGEVANPMNIVVIPSAQNAFVGAKANYPGAIAKPITGEGVSGELFVADNSTSQTKVYYAKVMGLQPATAQSQANAWMEYADGSFMRISTLELETTEAGPTAFFVYEDLTGNPATGIVISYENPESVVELTTGQSPTQKVAYVAL